MASMPPWELTLDAQMQDNDAAEKKAVKSIFGEDVDLNDCAVHFGREVDQRVIAEDRKQKKAIQEAMRQDFFMITELPDTTAQAELRQIASDFFMQRWQHKQRAAAQYVQYGLDNMRLTHAHVGPGRINNNNGEESSNRWTKVSFDYERSGISTFNAQLKDYLAVESCKDFCRRSRWERFSPAVWNGHLGAYVKAAINTGVMEMRGNFKNGVLIPRQRALDYVQGLTPAKAKVQLEGYRKVFRAFMRQNPKEGLLLMRPFHPDSPPTFGDFMDWMRSFAYVCPAGYPADLTELLHICMEVPIERRGQTLYRCHCETYMHYFVCGHVVLFHLELAKEKRYWAQLPKSLCHAVKVVHVNQACKQSDGPGAKKRKVIPGSALSKD